MKIDLKQNDDENEIIKYNSNISKYNKQSITYVTDTTIVRKNPEPPLNYGVYNYIHKEFDEINDDTYPQFLTDINCIVIPKKLKRHLERNIPVNLLQKIDKDKKIAIEKCLLIASNLTSTIFSEQKWKPLSSIILNEQIKRGKDNTFLYKFAIDVLRYNSNVSDAVIETKKNNLGTDIYQEGISSKQFKFTNNFSNNGVLNYYLKDEDCVAKRRKYIYKKLTNAINNPIGSNLINLYRLIELPTSEEINEEAKHLISLKFVTKKGKTLTFLNHRKKDWYSNFENRSFVEENIKTFQYLTQRGFMIPVIGNDKSGGRVFDSLNLMPSWIRKLIKIDGEPIVEIDFCALHPNIAMNIYGGQKKYITHQQIAEESGIDILKVKIDHLSFFNQNVSQMKHNVLYDYYYKSDKEMINRIVKDKYDSDDKHRITSKKLFKKEVEIMTKCITKLNQQGVYVGYVFDALFCKKKDAKIVWKVMNEEVLNNNVFTTAKYE